MGLYSLCSDPDGLNRGKSGHRLCAERCVHQKRNLDSLAASRSTCLAKQINASLQHQSPRSQVVDIDASSTLREAYCECCQRLKTWDRVVHAFILRSSPYARP